MSTIGVVGDGELAVPRGDVVGLGPEAHGLLGVELEDLGALEGVGVPVDDRRGEVGRRRARVLEDDLGHLSSVDRHGDGGTTQLSLLTVEVRQAGGDGERLEDGRGLVDRAVAELVLEARERGIRDGVEHVEVATLERGIGRFLRGVEDEVESVVHGDATTGVVGVHDELDLHVVLPRAFAIEHVGAVSDRVLTEGVDVVERRAREREERRVAEAQREVGLGLLERHGEGRVVDDLQAGQLGVLVVAETLDRFEEVAAQLGVAQECAVVPGVDERIRRDGLVIGERQVGLDLDGVGLRVFGLDRLGDVVDRGAVGLVVDESGEDVVEDLAATGLVGVGGDQGILGLGAVRGDDAAGAAPGGAGVSRGASGQHQCCRDAETGKRCADSVESQFSSCAGEQTARATSS